MVSDKPQSLLERSQADIIAGFNDALLWIGSAYGISPTADNPNFAKPDNSREIDTHAQPRFKNSKNQMKPELPERISDDSSPYKYIIRD